MPTFLDLTDDGPAPDARQPALFYLALVHPCLRGWCAVHHLQASDYVRQRPPDLFGDRVGTEAAARAREEDIRALLARGGEDGETVERFLAQLRAAAREGAIARKDLVVAHAHLFGKPPARRAQDRLEHDPIGYRWLDPDWVAEKVAARAAAAVRMDA